MALLFVVYDLLCVSSNSQSVKHNMDLDSQPEKLRAQPGERKRRHSVLKQGKEKAMRSRRNDVCWIRKVGLFEPAEPL